MTSSNRKTYSLLAWILAPPIGSFVMLFVGKDDPEVKYNAAHATAVHGIMFAGWIILRIFAVALSIFGLLLFLWDVAWFIVWIYGIILANQNQGNRFVYPGLGPPVLNLTAQIEGMAT